MNLTHYDPHPHRVIMLGASRPGYWTWKWNKGISRRLRGPGRYLRAFALRPSEKDIERRNPPLA